MEDSTDGPIFRANKRRKIFRKRAESDANDDETHVATSSQPDQAHPTEQGASIITGEEDVASRSDITRVRKPKKHGIAFSSSDRSSSRPHNDNEETALVISEPQPVEPQNGRFTRQTGKTIVEDDKHMSAYIDSKLAELRYGSSTPTTSTTQQPSHTLTGQPPASVQAQLSPILASPQPSQPPPSQNPQPTHPTKQPPKPSTRRRGPRPPSPSTTARATLIDQILRESTTHTPHYTSNPAAKNNSGPNTAPLDPDAAAAEAFKADFLAQAEARNLSRRHPAVNASAGSSAAAGAATSSGPKLGGSRAARERMRVAEEARGKK